MDMENLHADHLLCRDLRHPWQFVTDWGIEREGARIVGYTRELVCARCGTRRLDEFGRDFDKIGSRYRYAPGFLITDTGGQRIASADVTREQVRRARQVTRIRRRTA